MKNYSLSKKGTLFYWCIVIIIFLYIFNPRLFKFDNRRIIEILFTLLFLFDVFRRRKIKINKNVINILMAFFPFLFFSLINYFFHYNFSIDVSEKEALTSEFIPILTIFYRTVIVTYGVCRLLRRYDDKISAFFRILSTVAIIQLILVIISFLFPEVKESFLTIILNGVSENDTTYLAYHNHIQRGYGLAENLFDQFGYEMSLLISVFIVKSVYNNEKYIVLYFFVLISLLLNSRTGLLTSLFCLVVSFLFKQIKEKKIKRKTPVMVVGYSFLFIFLIYILGQILPQKTMDWVREAFNEVGRLLGNNNDNFNEYSTFDYLFITNRVFPENILFGAGYRPELMSLLSLDNGIISSIWRYGLIGVILLLGGFIKCFITCWNKCKSTEYKNIVLIFFITFIAFNIKIYSFGVLGSNIIIFTFFSLVALENNY